MTKELTKIEERDLVEVQEAVAIERDHKGVPDLSEVDEDDDGPLSRLTPMMRRFVEGWLALGMGHGSMTKAAQYAGYSPSTCSVVGSKLARDPRILHAVKFLAEKKAHSSAFAAMGVLEQVMETGTENNRLKAATTILGHAGIVIQTVARHEIEITDNRNETQVADAINEKMRKLEELGVKVGNMIDVSPTKDPKKDSRTHASGKRAPGSDQGRPKYKRTLVPRKELDDEEIDDIDWATVDVDDL